MSLNILLPVAVAIIAAIGTYLAAVRRLSGTVATSTAEDLWKESRAIRQDYQRRIEELNARLTELEGRNRELYVENGNLRRMLEEHEKTISSLRDQVERLSNENTDLRQDNIRLRARVTELEAS